MTIKVNAMGDACPIPVVKTQKAMQELGGAGTVETLVDNETAVQNLGKLAASKGCTSKTEKLGENEYRVTITVGKTPRWRSRAASATPAASRRRSWCCRLTRWAAAMTSSAAR